MRSIFPNRIRADGTRKKPNEAHYDFLKRWSGPGAEKTRSLMENWALDLSDSEFVFLLPRLKSRSAKSYEDFSTAFQELFLHQLLLRLGCNAENHPEVAGSTKFPDFEVSQPSGGRFLLEARTSFKESTGPIRDARSEVARDFLRNLDVGFEFGIGKLVPGTDSLPQKALKQHILKALTGTSDKTDDVIPIPDFTQRGWQIQLTGHKVESRSSHGSILFEAWGGTWSGPDFPLFKALKEKGSRYGNDHQMPFVIALDSADTVHTESDFYDSLFGAPRDAYVGGVPPTNRLSRGYWGTAGNPQHQQVSAVLFTVNLGPQPVMRGTVQPWLYLNPWATHPYEGVLTKLRTGRFVDSTIVFSSGPSLNEILNVAVEPIDLG